MKVIRNKATNEIIYVGDDLNLSDLGASGTGWKASNIKPDNYELLDVDTPENCKNGTHIYNGTTWTLTPLGSAYIEALAENVIEEQIKTDNESNLTNSALLTQLLSMSMDDVDNYIGSEFSSIADMTDTAIDTAVNGMVTIEHIRGALKALAKDNVRTKKILNIVAKLAVYLLKKE